ncbi:MAG: glycosyltransferase, partial [Bacteroidales bacterium]|nr:glycosyltransferase [Bacteroidales bacterium]
GPINIGLVGFIRNYNLSYLLLNNILKYVDCTITLIGPVDPEFYDNIIDKKKVILKGILINRNLFYEVNKFDVAIAPYLDRKINEGGVPNKLFLYLAMGKPVVATELLSLKQMKLPKKMIYLVKDMRDFPLKIKYAHEENNWDIIKKRIEYARKNTWDQRVSRFLSLLNEN